MAITLQEIVRGEFQAFQFPMLIHFLLQYKSREQNGYSKADFLFCLLQHPRQ